MGDGSKPNSGFFGGLLSAGKRLLMGESLWQIETVIKGATKVRSIMRQNFTWALLYNVSILPFAAFGFVAPWAAALGMSLSSLLVIANSLRLYKK